MAIPASARHAPGVDEIVTAHGALRQQRPLIQCLTNVVAANFMANVLLAAGASPAMVDNPEEAALFAGIADSVLINLGTRRRLKFNRCGSPRLPLKRRASPGC